MMSCLRDPELPLSQFLETSSTILAKIPESLSNAFADITSRFTQTLAESHRFYWERQQAFPVNEIQGAIDRCLMDLPSDEERQLVKTVLATTSIADILKKYQVI